MKIIFKMCGQHLINSQKPEGLQKKLEQGQRVSAFCIALSLPLPVAAEAEHIMQHWRKYLCNIGRLCKSASLGVDFELSDSKSELCPPIHNTYCRELSHVCCYYF